MGRRLSRPAAIAALVLATVAALVLPGPVVAQVEDEVPSPFYDSILYADIGPRLEQIEEASRRVQVDVSGQSAGGRDLYTVVVTSPRGRIARYKAINRMMLRDPAHAQRLIRRLGDYKVPVFINGSIHGNEYPGTDAAIRLIETLAFDDSPEVQRILDNVILVVNVVQNPDGRVLGTRRNANGFDLNRDMISQTQPETQITRDLITEWNPLVTLDLHGFVNPMLIEPTTPPHNPNYEYDLYLQWALAEAYAMEDALQAELGLDALIPYRDWDAGWDDWGSQYVPMYAMYHGSYGHTLETPDRGILGVDAHEVAAWGALEFVADHKAEMLHDQIEIFRRGALEIPQLPIPDELLDQSEFNQYNELVVQEFPTAHVIPVDGPLQQSPEQAERLVDFLVDNDVEVERANRAFSVDGETYPAGSYVVWMDQPKRGLANTMLDAGENLSDVEGITFYSPPSVWSHPLLWGASRTVVEGDLDVRTRRITAATDAPGSLTGANAPVAYAYEPATLAAFQATNQLLADGVDVERSPRGFRDAGIDFEPGTIIVPADVDLAGDLVDDHDLDVVGLAAMPDAIPMEVQQVAVLADEGTRHALGQLGVDFDELSTDDLDAGAIDDYDVLVNATQSWGGGRGLSPDAQASLQAWFDAGGDYVGLRTPGIGLATDAGIIDVDVEAQDGNAIVDVAFAHDQGVAGGYLDVDEAFVYTPAWFPRLGDGVDPVATLVGGDFLEAGYWPGWEDSGAAGMPVIVTDDDGDRDVTLIGLDATFRGHPENTFRLVGNAIWEGLD